MQVGVFASKEGGLAVVEYSEMDPAQVRGGTQHKMFQCTQCSLATQLQDDTKVEPFQHPYPDNPLLPYNPVVQAREVDPETGMLRFNYANICMHYFTVQWLQQVWRPRIASSLPQES
jgi:UDP-N-acetylglucosamine pyrophosphorylase